MKTHYLFNHPFLGLTSLLLSLLLLTSCDGCQEADIRITGMEITQGIQNASNSLPLVANRSTAVRVSLDTDLNEATGPVTGVLTVTVDGTEITPPGGLRQIKEIDAPTSTDKNIEDHTLNFELPVPSGITASSNVDFEVTINYANDTDESNNTFRVDNLIALDVENPRLTYVMIDYTPASTGLPNLSDIEEGVGETMVKGVFPVIDNDPDLYGPATPLAIGFSSDFNGNNLIDTLAESSALMSLLSSIRDLTMLSGTYPLSSTYIYGWLNGSPMNGFGGAGAVGGFTGYGNTTLTQYQRSYAHELGHNFGLPHNNRTLAPDIGWDTDARMENNPPTNNTTGRVKPAALVDIMNSGPPANGTWVDASTYTFFVNRLLINLVLPLTATRQVSPVANINPGRGETAEGVLVIQGYVSDAGNKVDLYPTLRLKAPAMLPPKRETGRFSARITTADGKRQRFFFDAGVCYEGQAALSYGFFELLVPMAPDTEVRSVEVFLNETRQKMSELRASPAAKVEILMPKAGGHLAGETTLSWKTHPATGNKTEMRYHVVYSTDEGYNWTPLAANLSENQFTFDADKLPPAEVGKGMLKVYACEGLNTSTTVLKGLTISGSRER